MSVVSNPIKEIKVVEFYPRDWDEFQETFAEYYGDIKEMLPEENRNLDGTIKIPYSAHIYVNKWHDSESTYNFLKKLKTDGGATIASNRETFWKVVPLIKNKNEYYDDFPSPKLEPTITNSDLDAKCWAPMKTCNTQNRVYPEEGKILFPRMISYSEHEHLMNEITLENDKNIAEKNMWHNDCLQYKKLYYDALERISQLEKKIL